MSDQSVDPYYLGPSAEDLDTAERALVEGIVELREMASLTHAPEWPKFEKLVSERLEVVKAHLVRTTSWENACRLQGRAQVYEWLLAFAQGNEVALQSAMQELKELQDRMEAQT